MEYELIRALLCLFSGLYGLPRRNGKIKDLSAFDARFFGISPKQADSMDPGLRMLLETGYEAILDAGEEKKQK